MKSKLPRIELPKEPLSPEWEKAVAQLVERALLVEEWANEMKARAEVSVGAYQTVILEVLRAYELGHAAKVENLLREAKTAIDDQRGIKSQAVN